VIPWVMDKNYAFDPHDHRNKLVQFEGLECLAYCDETGKWRSLFEDQELPGFVYVIDEDVDLFAAS